MEIAETKNITNTFKVSNQVNVNDYVDISFPVGSYTTMKLLFTNNNNGTTGNNFVYPTAYAKYGTDVENNDTFVELDFANEYDTGRIVELGNIKTVNNRHMGRQYGDTMTDVTLKNNAYPIVCNIDFDQIDVTQHEFDPQLSNDVDYPEFKLGFNHWIHASRNKTILFDQFKDKKQVYRVVNGYEPHIDDCDTDIKTVASIFFGFTDDKCVMTTKFYYTLWELLHYYELMSLDNSKFSCAIIAPKNIGISLHALDFFRNKYGGNTKNDKYYGILVDCDATDDVTLPIDDKIMNAFIKEHKLVMNNTTKKSNDIFGIVRNGIKDKMDLVVCNCGFEWTHENVQEQKSSKLILTEIVATAKMQKKGGCLVLKVFENYTKLSCKIMMILHSFYDKIDIIKPLTSSDSNSERYLICMNFKGTKDIDGCVDKMIDLLNSTENNLYITDVYPKIDISPNLMLSLITMNTDISNRQFKTINKMVEYIEGSNYYGELYQHYRERQVGLASLWTSTFLRQNNDYNAVKKEINKLLGAGVNDNIMGMNKFRSTLIGYDIQEKNKQPEKKTKKITRQKSIKNGSIKRIVRKSSGKKK